MASWRSVTKSQYRVYLKKWFSFCSETGCDIISPGIPQALDFLSSLRQSGLNYSSINTARCALSSILQLSDSGVTFGQLPIVKRFMKGVFEICPALPRYKSTWNVGDVLNYFRLQQHASLLTLKRIDIKSDLSFSIIKWSKVPNNTPAN